MAEKLSWIAETHKLIEEKGGVLTSEDSKHIRELMKIPNDDISIEKVKFKRHRSYLHV